MDDGSPDHFDALARSPESATLTSGTAQAEPSIFFISSWRHAVQFAVSDLIEVIRLTPAAHLKRLEWYKYRKGVPHEFLLLEVEQSSLNVWLRLERRPGTDTTMAQAIFLTARPADTATVCGDRRKLTTESQCEVKVLTTFLDPPSLQNLGNLLSIVIEESYGYKLLSENCSFFCSVIYDNLYAMGKGVDTYGLPTTLFKSRTRTVRKIIKNRMVTSLFVSHMHSTSSLTSNTSTDASLRPNRSPRPDSEMTLRDSSPRKIPTRSKRAKSEPGPVPDRPLVPRAYFDTSYDDLLIHPDRKSTMSSPHAPQRNGLCISIDFGATHSAVAFGTITSPKLHHIYSWPGSSDAFRKIPTCVVYDELGDVRAWGVEAREIALRKGWVRSEWFKLGLDPSFAASGIRTTLPIGKNIPDVVVDYLSCLWIYAKAQIMQKNTLRDINVANVYLTVPSSWDARICLVFREAAIKAGLVAQVTSRDTNWMDRLHIIAEPGASAAYCVQLPQVIKELRPNQQFMICNAGGGSIDMTVYKISRVWGTPEIAESCLRSGWYCGSLFLDLRFRELVRSLLADHPSHLDDASLAHFLVTFEVEKKNFRGPVDDDKYFHFRCLSLQDIHDPAVGLENGELIIPGIILRRDVFDPVITQVLEAIQQQMQTLHHRVDTLLLVGGFASSDYLFQRVKDAFSAVISSITRPVDGDLSSCHGGAKAGLLIAASAEPLVSSISALQSYIMEGTMPAEPLDEILRPTYIMNTGGVQICENRMLYLVCKGSKIERGVRIEVEHRKFSTSSYDSIFETVLYTSDSEQMMRYTDEGEINELCRCYVDLAPLPNFQEQARAMPSGGFYTDFELGFELDTAVVRGVLRYNGEDYGAISFDCRPGYPAPSHNASTAQLSYYTDEQEFASSLADLRRNTAPSMYSGSTICAVSTVGPSHPVYSALTSYLCFFSATCSPLI